LNDLFLKKDNLEFISITTSIRMLHQTKYHKLFPNLPSGRLYKNLILSDLKNLYLFSFNDESKKMEKVDYSLIHNTKEDCINYNHLDYVFFNKNKLVTFNRNNKKIILFKKCYFEKERFEMFFNFLKKCSDDLGITDNKNIMEKY